MSKWPIFSREEQDAALRVLQSGKVNYWTGQEGRLFEVEFAEYLGVNHAVAVSNGTVALELCLRALDIGYGDEVIVTSRTFLASATAIINCGAIPIFADVDLNSQNITVKSISAVKTNKAKAVIAVHLAGWPCDMPKIMSYAQQNNLFVIEDCAQAHGASIDGKKVGGFGDISAFSFCQDKIMTTGGEGGMVVTNNKDLWEKSWSYKDHGKSYDAVYHVDHPPGFRWLHKSFGTNFRMTEMQAAIGRLQLRKLDNWVSIRNKNANIFREYLLKLPFVEIPKCPNNYVHSYYKCYAFIKKDSLPVNWSRDYLMAKFNEQGMLCYSGSCSEIYLEDCFSSHPSRPVKRLKNAKLLGERSLMFLCDPTVDSSKLEEELSHIINKIMDGLGGVG